MVAPSSARVDRGERTWWFKLLVAGGLIVGAAAAAWLWIGNGTSSPPAVTFTTDCTGLQCTFKAAVSSSPDGSIRNYTWRFGDGGAATGRETNHSYDSAGQYRVTLTVTDAAGAIGVDTSLVDLLRPNTPPTASFVRDCAGLECEFDASSTSDPDGSIIDYEWDFGDGSEGSAQTSSHSYDSAGRYRVTLTVTDGAGATVADTRVFDLVRPNTSPTATFISDCTGLECTFDASRSSDPEGAVKSYEWNFGDGAAATGQEVSHVYQTQGSYRVTLTVRDSANANDTMSKSLRAELPSPVGVGFENFSGNVILDSTELQRYGIRMVKASSSEDYCPNAEPAVLERGLYRGLPVRVLSTATPGFITRCNAVPLTIEFFEPVKRVSVRFWGANRPYQLQAFDVDGNLVDSDAQSAEPSNYDRIWRVQVMSDEREIKRVGFGYEKAITTIRDIFFEW